MFSANQKQITEQDNFTNSPLGKAFEKKKRKKQLKIQKKIQLDLMHLLKNIMILKMIVS